MSASKQITALAEARGATREEVKAGMRDDAAVLGEVLDRMSVIEAKQSRPSPVKLNSWEEIERFAEKAARSGMVPVDYQNFPDKIAIAVQMGSELGLPPLQSLQNIAVIGNRPTVWGDAVPGLIRASGLCAYIKEWSEGAGDTETWYCEMKRRDDPNPVRNQFSVADAKKAGLWQTEARVKRKSRDGGFYEKDNDSPWFKYQSRMLKMRARGFTARDAFPDVLKGLITAEEAQDIPFEATGLTPRIEPLTTGQILGDSIPHMDAPVAKKRTWGDFLDELEPRLEAAQTGQDVDAIVAEPVTQKALDTLQNGAKKRLDDMIGKALSRTAPVKSQAQVDLEAALARTANRPPVDEPPDTGSEAAPIDSDPPPDDLLDRTLDLVRQINVRTKATLPDLTSSGKYQRFVTDLDKSGRMDLMNRVRDANAAALLRGDEPIGNDPANEAR